MNVSLRDYIKKHKWRVFHTVPTHAFLELQNVDVTNSIYLPMKHGRLQSVLASRSDKNVVLRHLERPFLAYAATS